MKINFKLNKIRKFILKKSYIKLLLLPLFFLNFNVSNFAYGNEEKLPKENEIDLQQSFYILGPGDIINIRIVDMPELSGQRTILNDGTIQIPLVGNLRISGLTIKQSKKIITEELSNELLKPIVDLTIIKERPIRVSLVGELARPGIYSLTTNEKTQTLGSPTIVNSGMPTLIDAIQKAGGITQQANLRTVYLQRKLPGEDNLYKKTQINLINLILEGDQRHNPYLFDGDIIKLEKATSVESFPNEITSANLSPSKIDVTIIGEVINPGKIQINSNTPLVQAVLAAGGPKNWRSDRGNVQLVRINRNGSAYLENFVIDFKQPTGTKNPPLLSGDVIKVNRSAITKSTDALSEITKPAKDLVTIMTLIKLFN